MRVRETKFHYCFHNSIWVKTVLNTTVAIKLNVRRMPRKMRIKIQMLRLPGSQDQTVNSSQMLISSFAGSGQAPALHEAMDGVSGCRHGLVVDRSVVVCLQ